MFCGGWLTDGNGRGSGEGGWLADGDGDGCGMRGGGGCGTAEAREEHAIGVPGGAHDACGARRAVRGVSGGAT